MTQLWSANVTREQYDFLRDNIEGFPEGTPIRNHIKVSFDIDNLRDVLNKIDRLHNRQNNDLSPGEIAEMYLNVDAAYQQYEDFIGLK